jgi:NAD(P)H-nitrite reductase large subunit
MKYVIVGASAAATAAVREIRERDASGEITLIAQDRSFFSRCQLHLVAAGERSPERANFLPEDWAERFRVNLMLGSTVTGVDANKKVVLCGGDEVEFDRLLIATGSRTFWPPVPGLAGPQSYGLRDLRDAETLRAELKAAKKVAVIGAGLVGVELAAELGKQGRSVTLIEMGNRPLPLQLEEVTGELCAGLLQENGVELICGDAVSKVVRDTEEVPRRLVLHSGREVEADLLVVAAGVRPNVEFLEGTGIEVNRGILIDEQGRTTVKDIYAAGDVVVMEDVILEEVMPSAIWPTAVRQGRVAGANMAGSSETLMRNTGLRASVSLLGVNIVSLGPIFKPNPAWEKQLITSTNSRGQRCTKVVYLDGDRLKAAILWGDITDAGVYTEAIINQRPLDTKLSHLAALDGAKRGAEAVSIL